MCQYCRGLRRLCRRADRLLKPERSSGRTEPLAPDLADRIIAELGKESDASLADIALIALQTGLHMREIAALSWADVDLDKKIMKVNGKAGIHTDSIPDRLAARLVQIRTKNSGQGRLFNRSVQSLTSSLKHAIRSVCKQMGTTPVNVRCLRLTFLSRSRQSTLSDNS